MTYRSSFWLAAAAAAVTLLTAPPRAGAQGITLSAVSASAEHRLLSDPLLGAEARVSTRLGHDRLAARLGIERVTAHALRTGSTCAGFIRPDEVCTPEPIRDDARLTTASAGLAFRAIDLRSFHLLIVGDLRLGRVQVDTRGLTTGRLLPGGKRLWGHDLGAEAAWTPWARVPLALEAGVDLGSRKPTREEMKLDGYGPFDQGSFAVTRLRAGVAWRWARR